MSLLLDALKRAEEAKRAKEGTAAPERPAPAEMSLAEESESAAPDFELIADRNESVSAPVPSAAPVFTPSPASASVQTPIPALASLAEPQEEMAYAPEPSLTAGVAAREQEQRDAARNVFAAKQAAPAAQSSKWLLLLVAVLVLGIGGGAWYAWMEVSKVSRPIAKSVPPPQPPPVQPAAAPDAKGAKVAAGALPPLLPPPAKEVPLPAVAVAKPVSMLALTEREALAKEIKDTPAAAPGAPVRLRLAKSFDLPRVNPDLLAGYQALVKGDYARALALYNQVVRAEPMNIDAHLGLAAAAARTGDAPVAAREYRHVLEIDPRNGMAISGLLAVSGQVPAESLETELRTLLSRNPDAPTLYFSLGNLYAGQKRWTEAQQAYFDACRLEPNNADYLYNLAVSLDQLNQRPLALDHYQRALAAKVQGQFDRAAVARRVSELKGG